jgi:hypothetical protein
VTRTSRPSPRRVATTLAVLTVTAASLAGCAQAVGVTVAPDATDPECARVVLALPEVLGDDLEQLRTTSQATSAWGDPTDPVTLRCGVEVPGPTTEQCVTMETAGGSSIDWLVRAGSGSVGEQSDDEQPGDEQADWTFVTYGRDPAVEVHVPAAVVAERSTSFLDGLSTAVAQVEATRSCL